MEDLENNKTNQQQDNDGSSGPVIGSIIIIVIIIVGGLYFWGKINQPAKEQAPEEILGAEDEALNQLQEQGTSDEVVDIEADLESTILDDLDSEIDNIESELNNL